MDRLTDQAWQKVLDLSNRYGISTDAVMNMLQAVSNGGGTMAQFFIPELGGGGQWMQGGMTMVGDMFNYGIKSKVDGLCGELAQLLTQQPFVPRPPQPQQQGQWSGGSTTSFSYGGSSGSWWPGDLGSPNGSGGQNNIRYAYFNNSRRLAIEINGNVTVYDTLDNQIGGVSQQQGSGTSITLSSQYGTIDVATLPVISINGAPPVQPHHQSTTSNWNAPSSDQEADIFQKIERLAELHRKGIISSEEFASKKSELMSRI